MDPISSLITNLFDLIKLFRFSQTKPASGDAVRRPSENNVISAAIGPALGIIGMPSNSGIHVYILKRK